MYIYILVFLLFTVFFQCCSETIEFKCFEINEI